MRGMSNVLDTEAYIYNWMPDRVDAFFTEKTYSDVITVDLGSLLGRI